MLSNILFLGSLGVVEFIILIPLIAIPILLVIALFRIIRRLK